MIAGESFIRVESFIGGGTVDRATVEVRSFAGGRGSIGLRVDCFFVALEVAFEVALEVDCFFVAFGFDRVDTIGVDTLSRVEIETVYTAVS